MVALRYLQHMGRKHHLLPYNSMVSIRPVLIAADSSGTNVQYCTVPPRTPRIVRLRLKVGSQLKRHMVRTYLILPKYAKAECPSNFTT